MYQLTVAVEISYVAKKPHSVARCPVATANLFRQLQMLGGYPGGNLARFSVLALVFGASSLDFPTDEGHIGRALTSVTLRATVCSGGQIPVEEYLLLTRHSECTR